MATSASMRNFAWGDGLQIAGQDLRLETLAVLLSGLGGPASNPLGVGSGVRDGTGSPLAVAVATGLSVTVNPGLAVVQGSAAADSGAYSCCLDAAATLTCSAADLVNPRVDAVIVQVVDNSNNTSTATVNILTGTPAASPSAPALPSNSLALCYITVPANASSLVSGNLADQRTYLAAAGGIQPVRSSTAYPGTGPASGYAHDLATGRLKVFTGSALTTPKTAPWAPAVATAGSIAATSTAIVTGAPVTVTVDGSTQVRISFTAENWAVPTGSVGNGMTTGIARDGAAIVAVTKMIVQTTQRLLDGGTITYVETPAAGTHTYTAYVQTQGLGSITAQAVQVVVEPLPA